LTTLDLKALRTWIGRTESGVDHVTVPMVERLSATLDRDDPPPRRGDPLPAGWHGVLFPRVVRHSHLGRDGHPARGDFVPPVPLPRRMNGGRRIALHGELRIGDEVHRTSTIRDLQLKEGRSGRMVVVTVATDIHTSRGLAVSEAQDIVYRDEPEANAPDPSVRAAPSEAPWRRSWTPDPVMLFRFSAIMFNGHRIHYDAPYVTRVEGYPGLIVNGGLSALLVFELARECANRPLAKVSLRNTRAMYVNRPLEVRGAPREAGERAAFWIADADGALTLNAEVEFS
jgi:3-methylfumaryl-CoA hydratase